MLFSMRVGQQLAQEVAQLKMADIENGLVRIGERITTAKEKAGLSEVDLATFAGATEDEVRCWEASESRPELWQVLEMATRCDVSPDWLLGRDLIEEFFVEQSRHQYVCLKPGSNPFEISLDDLDTVREFICYAKGWKGRTLSLAS